MTISFSDRVEVPKHVLVRFLDNESVFLNLETEHYYGLDEIGTRMWQAVTAAPYLKLLMNSCSANSTSRHNNFVRISRSSSSAW